MQGDEKSIDAAAEVSNKLAEHPGVSEELLRIAPRIYREYADEFRELARTSESDHQRSLYLKAAHVWLDAATRFEMGAFNSEHGSLQKPAA